jgi:hypothetical protein
MFNLLGTENELDRMRKAHNLKLEKLKLQGEMYIEENKIKNDISLNKLKAEKDQLKVNNEIRELKTEVKQDKSIIKAGTFLNFWGTLGTIVSTLLTIAGLWSFFNGSYLKAVSFILAIVMTQFTVYILAKQDTNIKKHFAQHAFKVSVLKFVLLSISIYGNYTFFTSERNINFIEVITTLALCIAIDVISIYCISIAQDFRTLNKNVSRENLYKGLIGKVIYNLTYKFVTAIETRYQENKNKAITTGKPQLKLVPPLKKTETFVNDKDTVNKEPKNETLKSQEPQTLVNDKEVDEVLKAIFEHKDGFICPSISFLTEKTNLTRTKIHQVKKYLDDLGIINTTGMTTSLNVDTLEDAKKAIESGGVSYEM